MDIVKRGERDGLFEIEVTLSGSETAQFAQDAWLRMARLLKMGEQTANPGAMHITVPESETDASSNEEGSRRQTAALGQPAEPNRPASSEEARRSLADAARAKAHSMLTAREQQTFLSELAMARAAELAFAEKGVPFMLSPEVMPESTYREGEPFSFLARVHEIPAMELDIEEFMPPADESEAPDASGGDSAASDEARALRILRARLHGTMPESLVRAYLKRKKDAFHASLDEQGLTYREYRIQNNLKPHEVEDGLYDEALDELAEDIALDLVFQRYDLGIEPTDEAAALTALASGLENEFKRELTETGRSHLIAQKARRLRALHWAAERL